MTLDQIAAELSAITDDIAAVFGNGDLQYCLEDVEARLTGLVDRIGRSTYGPPVHKPPSTTPGVLPTDHVPEGP